VYQAKNRGVFILEEHSGGCYNFGYVSQRREIRFRQETFRRVKEREKKQKGSKGEEKKKLRSSL